MKISPVAQSSGQPGESLTSTNVGRTADPMKMDRARAIARGEKVPEQVQDPERIRPDARKLKMRTNFSTNRDDNGQFLPQTEEVPAEAAVAPETQSSETDTGEPGAVEATQPLSPQFAALAKQKRALQLERAEFEKLKAEAAPADTTTARDELIAKLKSSPLSVLQEHGVTYDQLTEAILGQGQNNPEIQALRDEIKALKEGVDKSFSTREEQQEEAALTEMLYEAEGLAKEGDAFEMIRERDAYDQVLRLIHSTYKQTGRVLDVTEAMNRVESKLLADAEKLASINKVRNKLSAPAPAPLKPQQPQGMRTLTARDTASPLMDRRARAIAAAMGTLKR